MSTRKTPSWLNLAAIVAIGALAACAGDEAPADPTPSQPTHDRWWQAPATPTEVKPRVIYPQRGTSVALGEILARAPRKGTAPPPRPDLIPPVKNSERRAPSVDDAVMQREITSSAAPDPTLSFDGMSNADNQAGVGFRVWPPDPNGDVGPNHYVQWVNLSIAVYDKSGALLVGPSPGNTPWADFSGPCNTNNDGDPIVLYDQLADRWVFSQFAITGSAGHQCFAVSTTADPLGPYHLYDYVFSPGGGINDYPKLSVWPDGYYLTVNDFAGSFRSAVAAAVDRVAMLDGLPAALVKFDVTSADPNETIFSLQPSHLEGRVLPPAGSPNFIVNSFDDETWSNTPDPTSDRYNIWAFHVDWTDPGASTLLGPTTIAAPEFDAELCGFSRSCIPQPPGGSALDTLGQFTMYRVAYRNLGSHDALVLNHTVDSGGDRAGIRWSEIRNPTTTPELFQTGTFAPDDGLNRWMGSAAMDGQGNIALAYSVSSATTFPSLRYAARLAGDPLGELAQGEAVIVTGSTAQTSFNRWGDYASMSVDELDDCTFWFTGEYASDAHPGDWSTRIASFTLPLCTATEIGTVEGVVTDGGGAPLVGARVTAGGFSATTNGAGFYRLSLIPGTYDVTASSFGFIPQTEAAVDVTASNATIVDFALEAAELAPVQGAVFDDGGAGWPLYAKLTFTAQGAPPVTVFTNPANGFYRADLPVGTDFDLSVQALVAGYVNESRPVTPIPGGTVAHFALDVNTGSCEALGYAESATDLLAEDFEGAFPPAGWTVENTTTGCSGTPDWSGSDPGGRGNLTGGGGLFAGADSDQCGPSVNMSTTLTSPPIDLSAFDPNEGLSISFSQDLLTLPGTSARLEIWNGFEWIVVSNQTTDSRGPVRVTFGSSAGNGLTDARIRFVYESGWDWWWLVDDVAMQKRSCDYRQGGLVFGEVRDRNTGLGLVGATVSTGTEAPATTVATPADPAIGDGLYFTFMPLPGQVTAEANKYRPRTVNVTPQINGAQRRNFQLNAGRIRVEPGQIALRAPFGGTASATLTVINDGTAAATVDFAELEGRAVSRPSGPFAPPGRRLGPKNLFDKDARNVRSEDPPPAVPVLAAGEVNRSFSTGLTGGWGAGYNSDVGLGWIGDIAALGGGDDLVEFENNGNRTGRAIDVSSYGNVFGADVAYDSTTGMLWQVNVGGDNCIHEVDPSAGTVTGNTICPAFGTSERGLAYDPVTETFYAGSWNDARVVQFDRSGTILRAVQTGLNVSGLAYNPDTAHLFVLSNGATADVTVLDANADLAPIGEFDFTSNGSPVFADFAQAGLALDCNGDLWAVDQQTQRVVVGSSGETRNCVQDLPWLVVNPQSLNVPAGQSRTVTVTLDAAQLTPGFYEAQLLPRTNTPYAVDPVAVAAEVRFRDVGIGSYGDAEIHALAGADITFGCGGGNFCPADVLTRRVYAVWGLRSALGADYVPPRALGLLFGDLAPDSFGADFVEDAYNRGYMDACGERLFCADSAVNRGESAITILRLANGPAFVPPAATGVFNDVAPNLAPWAEEAWRQGIMDACGPAQFCPSSATIRADHAIWLVRAFGFPIFGL